MNILSSSASRIVVCGKCDSVLEIIPNDVKFDELGHGTRYREWYICPLCSHMNSLEGKLPKEWLRIIYNDVGSV